MEIDRKAADDRRRAPLWILVLKLGVFITIAVWIGRKAILFVIPDAPYLADRAAENTVRTDLGTIRSALSIYKSDRKRYPTNFVDLVPQYLVRVPEGRIPLKAHRAVNQQVTAFSSMEADDRGGWGYVSNPASSDFGKVFVNCTHTDSKGIVWSSY